jgi:hypothetical protein
MTGVCVRCRADSTQISFGQSETIPKTSPAARGGRGEFARSKLRIKSLRRTGDDWPVVAELLAAKS